MSITLVQKNKSKGIMTWYARVPDSRGVHFFSLGTTSKSEAKSVLQDKIRDGAFEIKDVRETATLGEAVAMTPEKIFDGDIHVKGKGDKFATIPVSPRLQREIDRCPPPWDFHFAEPTLISTVAKALPEGFPGKAHAHRFRHSFGSNLIRAGVNIKTVQQLMRHENITITLDIYGHILDSDTRDAVEKVFK